MCEFGEIILLIVLCVFGFEVFVNAEIDLPLDIPDPNALKCVHDYYEYDSSTFEYQ